MIYKTTASSHGKRKTDDQGFTRITLTIVKSPLPPSLPKRGIIPPFVKGRSGGILQINVASLKGY
jgi:hypothetical protein